MMFGSSFEIQALPRALLPDLLFNLRSIEDSASLKELSTPIDVRVAVRVVFVELPELKSNLEGAPYMSFPR